MSPTCRVGPTEATRERSGPLETFRQRGGGNGTKDARAHCLPHRFSDRQGRHNGLIVGSSPTRLTTGALHARDGRQTPPLPSSPLGCCRHYKSGGRYIDLAIRACARSWAFPPYGFTTRCV